MSVPAGEQDRPRRSVDNVNLYKVADIPPAAYYVPNFITPEEEEYLLRKVAESPQPKWRTVGSGRRLQYWGGTLSKSGVLLPDSLPQFLTSFPNIIERIERFLDDISTDRNSNERALGINQVLVNEYQPGQGISPHEDGGAFRPLVATITLGSHTVLDIHHYLSETSPSPPMIPSAPTDMATPAGRPIAAVPLAHLLLLPRSLLVLSSSLYTSHLHGIAFRETDVVRKSETSGDGVVVANLKQLGELGRDLETRDNVVMPRGMRTSLTFRRAGKVVKGGAFLGVKR